MNLRVFDEMRFLTESFAAHFAPERFFAGMRTQVDFDVGLVEESSIADVAPVYSLFFAEIAVVVDDAGGDLGFGSISRLFAGRRGVREADLQFGRRPGRAVHLYEADVRGADHVAGRTVRRVGGGGGRRRALGHDAVPDILSVFLLGRAVLQPALQQRHMRKGGSGDDGGGNRGVQVVAAAAAASSSTLTMMRS